MDFIKLANERYSVRSFSEKAVSDETVNLLLKAAAAAPTACNYQPQRILIIRNEAALEKLKGCTRCHFNAPLAMLICVNKNQCWTRKYDGASSGWVDGSIVATHIMLAAHSLGLGSTWVMHFDPLKMRAAFKVPDELEMVALLPMGYPAEDAEPLDLHYSRRDTEELAVYNSFE